uniref:Uncharacterized protein n=1 Tax=Salix viminalis TaxID=40686 RepID=A0A6N2L7A2_SALVM
MKKAELVFIPRPSISHLVSTVEKPNVKEEVSRLVSRSESCPGLPTLAGFVLDKFCTSMIDVPMNLVSLVYFPNVKCSFSWPSIYVQALHDEQKVDPTEFKDQMPSWSCRRCGIMVNTFEELESQAIKSFSNGNTPPVYPVGPMLNLNRDGDRDVESDKYKDIGQWLDDQPLSSLGSFGVDQVKEIACGLEQSGHRFLWSLRQPPPKGKMEPPSEYTNPRDVRCIPLWMELCIGKHSSGCTWPLYAEQQFNAFTLIVEMGLGVEIKMDYRSEFHLDGDENNIVSAGEIERGVRCLMELDNGKRERLKEMSGKSRKAVESGGTSSTWLGRFIQDVIDHQP